MKSDVKEKLTFVILGRSGCGKGTQAEFLLSRLAPGVHHMSTGKFLRELMTKNNITGEISRRVMHEGKLYPGWLAAYTWLREIIEGGHADKHLVFDGAPRRMWEAKLLDEVMEWHERSLPLCIYIDVGRKEAMRRLRARGRADDEGKAIRNRMRYFPKDVMPVIRYYGKSGRLIQVNGEQSMEGVRDGIDQALSERLGALWSSK